MFCENELRFLCDTMKKSRVRTAIGSPRELSELFPDVSAEGFLHAPLSGAASFYRLFEATETETVTEPATTTEGAVGLFQIPGCGGSVIPSAVVLSIIASGALMVWKKKKD